MAEKARVGNSDSPPASGHPAPGVDAQSRSGREAPGGGPISWIARRIYQDDFGAAKARRAKAPGGRPSQFHDETLPQKGARTG